MTEIEKISKFSYERMKPYIYLMRLNSPVGIFLLMWPGLWSIALASEKELLNNKWILIVFILGSVLARSAGCVINDIIDRNIDLLVERTKLRPIASGDVSLKQAFILLILLFFFALCLLLTLNKLTIIIGVFSIIPIIIYPFMKRIISFPQIFLGITFNISAIMGWTAIKGKIEFTAIILYVACIFWTIGYDTIYAHQDKKDDEKFGIKSSAVSLGDDSLMWIENSYKVASVLIIVAAIHSNIQSSIQLVIFLPLLHLYWQVRNLDLSDSNQCLRRFNSNVIFGLLVFFSFLYIKS